LRNLIFLVLLLSTKLFAQTTVDNITQHTLKNGLQVVVLPDHRAPLAWFQIWYKVGSSDETLGKTGIAHALEHMMFKGTTKYPKGKIWELVSGNGGSQNAFTSYDYTCYWQQWPKDKLELSFDIESDRMQNLIFSTDEFKKERQVILEERRMRTEDSPQGLAYEQFMAAANQASNYQNPVIGWARDIENINIQDLKNWHNKWYMPNNAIIVIAGDVDPQNILMLADKYFANIEPNIITTPENLTPTPQLGSKTLNVQATATVPSLILGYKAPSLKTTTAKTEIYALTLLDQILTGGNSAIFTQDLVYQKNMATTISSYYSPFAKYSSTYSFFAVPTSTTTTAQITSYLQEQITKLQHEEITPEALQKAKAQAIAAEIYAKESIEEQALNIGAILAVGLSIADYDDFIAGIQKVSAKQLQQVAKKYLLQDQATIVYLEPKSMTAIKTTPAIEITGANHD
jgi:zinc protease